MGEARRPIRFGHIDGAQRITRFGLGSNLESMSWENLFANVATRSRALASRSSLLNRRAGRIAIGFDYASDI
jgi:hypothetical protein